MRTAISLALRALVRARFRTALTLLGILIGTSAVVVVFALGTGARERIAGEIENLGSAAIFVFPQTFSQGGLKSGGHGLTETDAAAIARDATAVRAVTVWSTLRARVHSRFESHKTSVMGVDDKYFDVRAFALADGRTFDARELRTKAKVAVIGQTVKTELFGSSPAVGEFIRIGQHSYRIIGLLAEKGRTPFEDQDDRVILPVSTFRARVSPAPGRRVHMILASAKTRAHTEQASAQISSILRHEHHLGSGDPEDFIVRSQEGFRKTQETILDAVTSLLLAVAGVALFIGGIGVMNITLIGVAERTREIGVRMSVGARKTDILLQFLLEAVVLALAGGILGVLLSALVALSLTQALGWSLELDIGAALAALSMSLVVGVVFGIWPARRAAMLDPVEALRQS
jgi:putative ABC transport system permease protein